MPRDKVLLISCYFPPAGGIGVQRAVSLARYLPENGIDVFVLTARASLPTMDPDLLKLVPKEVQIHRTWTFEPPFRLRKKLWSRLNSQADTRKTNPGLLSKLKKALSQKIKHFTCPDPQVLWYPFAIRRASKLIRREQIQTVVVTAPPFSAFLIANELKRRFPGLCIIADVRDEWLEYFAKEFVFRGDKYIADRCAQIERGTVESCDRVVSVTQTSLNEVRSRYPQQPSEKFVLIPNGFEPSVFAEFSAKPHQTKNLLVTYTGTIYKPCSPKPYLDALDRLPEVFPHIETRFVGRIAEEFDRSIFENRNSSLHFHDFVPQKEALSFMEEADLLLLPWTDRFNIPGKVFEYLATGKPILAICSPDSEVARIIRETASGWCVNPDDIADIQRVLTEIYVSGGKYPRERNWEAIRSYERPRLAAEYAQLIRDARSPRKSHRVELEEIAAR
jgi:glycosyltransferase involved in cell wall biosynthesis